jgi:hypothetical protein
MSTTTDSGGKRSAWNIIGSYLRDHGNWFLAGATWIIAWVFIWANNVPKDDGGLIFEPALVALSLGLVAILVFAHIYDKEKEDKMRSAVAATFIFVFLFLVIDLLTIGAFRSALSDVSDVRVAVETQNGLVVSTAVVSEEECSEAAGTSTDDDRTTGTECLPVGSATAVTFVEGLFGTFKWAITAIIVSFFLASAAEKVSKDRTDREKQRTDQEREKTDRERLKAGRPPTNG